MQFSRIFAEYGGHSLPRGVATKSSLTREHLVHHSAKSKNICAWIGYLAPHLLRCHIAGGPHDSASGSVRAGHRSPGGVICFHDQLGQAEVENFYPSIFGDE